MSTVESPKIDFVSSNFHAETGEENLTHPGVYGKALAAWMATKLGERGQTCGTPSPEEWGWRIPVTEHGTTAYVACSNVFDSPNMYTVFVFADTGVVAKLAGRAGSKASVDSLYGVVKDILQIEYRLLIISEPQS